MKAPNAQNVVTKLHGKLCELVRSDAPIVVGPWLTETGFELLYWIPFLRWAKAYAKIDAARMVIVSRGGCASWYQDISARYVDLFDFYTVKEFRDLNDCRIREQGTCVGPPSNPRGTLKHLTVTRTDHAIIDAVAAKHKLRHPLLLHPSLMYNLFRPFWKRVEPHFFDRYTKVAPLPKLQPDGLHLPASYVAAKFYMSSALSDTTANREHVAWLLKHATMTGDVVLLNTGTQFDDHHDYEAKGRGRLHRVDHLMTPRNNLEIQTRVIAGASGFMGTYGGFSYLAPMLGVPTRAWYAEPRNFRKDHLQVAERIFANPPFGSFSVQPIGGAA